MPTGPSFLERLHAVRPPTWEQARKRMELPARQLKAGKEFIASLPKESDPRLQKVWQTFAELAATPRPSGKEYLATAYVRTKGAEYLKQQLITKMEPTDTAGNVVWEIPASSKEYDTQAANTILQAHLDAVSKSINPAKNPAQDGMELEIVNGVVQSKGQETTAGLDNGVMAAYLIELPRMLQELGIPHGKLKLVFTTGEEDGFIGAPVLASDFTPYGNLINIDSEEERYITVGASAIGQSELTLNVNRVPVRGIQGKAFKKLRVFGLHGGHSGVTIADTQGPNPTRQNAIHEAATLLKQHAPTAQIASVDAPANLLSAISTDASIIVALSPQEAEELENAALRKTEQMKLYGEKETASVVMEDLEDLPDTILTPEDSQRTIDMLYSLPIGVPDQNSKFKPDPKPLVIQNRMKKDGHEESELVPLQVATNLARALLDPQSNKLTVGMMTRSCTENAVDDLNRFRQEIRGVAESFGALAHDEAATPAWSTINDTNLSKLIQQVYKATFPNKTELSEIATLGGLEVAIFLQNNPHLVGHTVSIGPDIFGAHSETEQSPYDSVERVCGYIFNVIAALADKGKQNLVPTRRGT